MSTTADIVVAGAGHNSLIAAAYLASAGRECVILDSRAVPGGGAATEEPLLPGFRIDTCSTGHTLIRVNPVLANDELGLHADYGLEYIEPDPVAHVVFPDGEQMRMWLDLDRTCEEIARFLYDTVVHDQGVLRELVQWVGADHVLLGSDYPFDMGDPRPVESVRALGLPAAEEELILGAGIGRLLDRDREEALP